jgi:hypothetical protein
MEEDMVSVVVVNILLGCRWLLVDVVDSYAVSQLARKRKNEEDSFRKVLTQEKDSFESAKVKLQAKIEQR